MSSFESIQSQFGIPGTLRIERGNGGLTKIVVTGEHSDGEVYLHGAHVTHFQPRGQKPVLFLSKAAVFEAGKPIRGGVPICFPWFGPNANDPAAPVHGFARLREWSLDGAEKLPDGSVRVVLSLKSDEATRKVWPADFVLTHVVTFGRTLEMRLDVLNVGPSDATFEEALHTYLAVGDVRRTAIEGLGGVTYLDKTRQAARTRQDDPTIRVVEETDRVYLDTTAACVAHDAAWNRKLRVDKAGSNVTVVWNPWIAKAKAMADFGDEEWPDMLCIETCNSKPHAVTLPAGATHTMRATIGVG